MKARAEKVAAAREAASKIEREQAAAGTALASEPIASAAPEQKGEFDSVALGSKADEDHAKHLAETRNAVMQQEREAAHKRSHPEEQQQQQEEAGEATEDEIQAPAEASESQEALEPSEQKQGGEEEGEAGAEAAAAAPETAAEEEA